MVSLPAAAVVDGQRAQVADQSRGRTSRVITNHFKAIEVEHDVLAGRNGQRIPGDGDGLVRDHGDRVAGGGILHGLGQGLELQRLAAAHDLGHVGDGGGGVGRRVGDVVGDGGNGRRPAREGVGVLGVGRLGGIGGLDDVSRSRAVVVLRSAELGVILILEDDGVNLACQRHLIAEVDEVLVVGLQPVAQGAVGLPEVLGRQQGAVMPLHRQQLA